MTEPESIKRLINRFSKLPGVGQKTARRYAYSVIGMSDADAEDFCKAIADVKQNVRFCSVCGNFTDKDVCDICQKRDRSVICVVAYPKDILAIEKSNAYDGVYHVLFGTLSPMDGRTADDLHIRELIKRLDGCKEIILATNPDVEGEATARYIAKLVKPFEVKCTRLAQGISMGSDIEYADEATLTRAIEQRVEI